MPATIHELLKDYLLTHDLAPTTEQYYTKTISVFVAWLQRLPVRSEFTPELVSEFLHAKQQEGLSSHYRKSLRSGLRALLNHEGQRDRIRSVRLEALSPEAWNKSEVSQLLAAIPQAVMRRNQSPLANDRRWFWSTIIPMAWHTGLERMDLVNRFEASSVDKRGIVVVRRHKTGKRVVVSIPVSLASEICRRPPGPIWRFKPSSEYFRRQFGEIVAKAGLRGTFKKLRKSSGTAIELLYPGRGHEHLANTRAVFEKHYLAASAMPIEPLSVPELPRLDAS